jgi:hypothetical protein
VLQERHQSAPLIVVAGEFQLRELPRLLAAGTGGVVHVVRADVRPAAAQVGDRGHPRGDRALL